MLFGAAETQGNSVGSESVMAMADALKTNTALKDLRLCNNAVGAVSVAAL